MARRHLPGCAGAAPTQPVGAGTSARFSSWDQSSSALTVAGKASSKQHERIGDDVDIEAWEGRPRPFCPTAAISSGRSATATLLG